MLPIFKQSPDSLLYSMRGIIIMLLLPVLILNTGLSTALAASWPSRELRAEAAVVMDADTGCILFEKSGTERHYPASITKVMTALVVLKHAEPSDMVSFSHDAVYNVDRGSSNAQIDEGDVLSVEDCLYALLLKSANEAANALAEHISGSREAFCELMNEEAAALGCTGTHFVNPSGLTAEEHYTTARDMALIGAAAFENEEFLKIESSLSHKLPPTRRVSEGLTIYMEHKMLLPNSPYYDKRVVAGKTGYTMAAGNTLITLAEYNGRRLVAVVLKDKNPAHYTDTGALLELGFKETENIELEEELFDLDGLYERLVKDTVIADDTERAAIRQKGSRMASVPLGTGQDKISIEMSYNLPSDAPGLSLARLEYMLDGKQVGHSYLIREQSIRVLESSHEEEPESRSIRTVDINYRLLGLGFASAIMLLLIIMKVRALRAEKRRRSILRERRKRRLDELSISEDEFNELLRDRRKNK